MGILKSIIIAAALSADCFAVSLCSSVTLKQLRWREVLRVAVAFAVIQTWLILAGWYFGALFAGAVPKISHIIGFLLLLYVGGSMFIGGLRGGYESRNLNGWRNIIICGLSTSIDALTVGVAQSMAGQSWNGFSPLLLAVFVITALSVVAGIWGGSTLGRRFGCRAEIAGGLVLVGIGISLLL